MVKKQQEIENYQSLITVFTDYEKYTLMEYSGNDDTKLVFLNPKNKELGGRLNKVKEGIQNPFTPLSDWVQEEEIELEAMIEAVESLNNLEELKFKLGSKIKSLTETLVDMRAGKKTMKSIFSFKSKEEDINQVEREKCTAEKSLTDMEEIIKIASLNMEEYIGSFKFEKLSAYYKSLKYFSQLSMINASEVNELWDTVSHDKNIIAVSDLER